MNNNSKFNHNHIFSCIFLKEQSKTKKVSLELLTNAFLYAIFAQVLIK